MQENAKPGLFKNTYLNNIALSNSTGKISFNLSLSNSGYSSIVVKSFKYKTIEVDCITLDEYCNTHNTPSVIKIDVEGAEYLVLLGAKNVLINKKPLIAMEVYKDENHKKAVDFLLEIGYNVYDLDENANLVKIPDPTEIFSNESFEHYSDNLIFLHKEAQL